MGRPKGSKNKPIAERVAKVETRARMKLAKAGVVLAALVPPPDYAATIKPGQRDLTDRFARLQEAIEMYSDLKRIKCERSQHPLMQDVPGGSTGMVTFTWVRNGPDSYGKASRTDTGLDGALMDKLVYISKELGQFMPDVEVHLKDGRVQERQPVDYSCLSMEDLGHLQRIAKIIDAHRKGNAIKPQAPEKDEWKD